MWFVGSRSRKQNGIVPVVQRDVMAVGDYTSRKAVVMTMMSSIRRPVADLAAHATTGSAHPPASRWHGSLNSITDTQLRGLRPIGVTAHEAAVRTGALLAELVALPGIQIFQGVRQGAADLPRIPHVVTAGRKVILVESVAWPPGRYTAATEGRIYCNGAYIGQSMRPLKRAIRHWQEILPPGHRVSGLVAVHQAEEGDLRLADTAARNIAWVRARDVVGVIEAHLPRRGQSASIRAVAALIAAIAEEENR
jgi:hypothetical protein